MIKAIYKLIFLKWMGWKIVGEIPKLKRFMYVVAPHTSNWDFVLGLFTRRIMGFKSNYIAKKELFIFPFGYFFRYLGGYPVDRKKNFNFVQEVIRLMREEEEFIIAITPEGTRSYAEKWKTGFYYIAKKANVPVVRVAIDYSKKQVVFDKPHYITEDKETCVSSYKKYFSQFKGRNPENGVKWEE